MVIMPVNKNVLLRYRVLDRCLRNAHREYDAKDLLKECNKELEAAGFTPVKLRTIYDDLKKLGEEPYNAPIEKLPGYANEHVFRYEDSSFVLPLVTLDKDDKELLHKTIEMLKAYDGVPQYQWVTALLAQIENGNGVNEMRRYVEFQNNPDLMGIEHFQTLLGAIMEKQALHVVYKPYGKEDIAMNLYPYYLKQFNDRWYLVARVQGYESLTVLAIDRINRIELLHVDFVGTDADMEEFFDNVIGVTVYENKPVQEVRLRISEKRYPYIETKPLHWTQTELKGESGNGWRVVRLRVKVNNELEAAILYFGDDVEVLAPESLRKQIGERIKCLAKMYGFADTLQSE